MYLPNLSQVQHLQLNTAQLNALQNLITLSGQFDTDLFIAACDEVADSPLFEGDLWEEVNMCLGWA